jgi:hypothetical protein
MANSPDILLECLKEDLLEQQLPFKGDFWPGMSIREAAAISISNSLLKKFEFLNNRAADEAAIDKFLQINEKCRNWTLPVIYDSKTEMLLNGFKAAINDFWFKNGFDLVDHPYDLLSKSEIGPGANLKSNGGDFYTKFFSSPLSCSDLSLYTWYRRYISGFPEWSNAELIRKENYGEPIIVAGNKLSLVAKNDKISRCICTEPTLNTYFQLGLGAHLERRLKDRFAIDLKSQQFKNRDLARLGSITDGLSTIDLSSASDSMSLNMLKWCLPPSMFRMLAKYRCPVTTVPGRGVTELHMISTMGNGYTFPLQTMLFCCAVVACFQFRGLPLDRSESSLLWGVNGDDIVCPKLITSDVISLLAILGFDVNDDKTFVEGPFRESCGSDFFLGTNIRGVYVKRITEPQDLFSVFNRLVRFSTRHGISFDRTLHHVLSLLRKSKAPLCLVPPSENIDSGIHCSYQFAKSMKASFFRHFLYHYTSYEVRVSKLRITDTSIVVPRRDKRRIYNPSGLFISYLQGCIVGFSIGSRKGYGKWSKRRRKNPNWGLLLSNTARDCYDYALDWRRWESDTDDILTRFISP